MAHSKNGKYIGAAAHYQRIDDAEYIQSVSNASPKPPAVCVICGGDVEAVPMINSTCYDCYRDSCREAGPENTGPAQDAHDPTPPAPIMPEIDFETIPEIEI